MTRRSHHRIVAGLLFVLIGGAQAGLIPERLRCEHLDDPLGIDVARPRLSWRLRNPSMGRGQVQTAWRVWAASTPDKLECGQGDLWDSGRVTSAQSVRVPYQGKPLRSRQRCWPKVRVWDAEMRPGPWSDTAVWEMALLEPQDWQAQWIAVSPEETSPPPREPVPIIFDTDMGSDCDDVGALALLHTYADRNRARILGCIYSSGKVPYGGGVIDAINTYYGRADIPVGANHATDVGDPVDKMNAAHLIQDKSRFGNTIVYNRDAEEMTRLNRRLLAAQRYQSVVYVTVGHTQGLYNLLVSEPDAISPLSGMNLVQQKVKRWVALGALAARNETGEFGKDWNFCFNGTARYTQYLVENFPRPVAYVTGGTHVLTGKSLKNTAPGNIVRAAYEEWLGHFQQKTLDDQRPSWDLVAVYYAVEGLGDYLALEPNGCLEMDVNRGCRWVALEGDSRQSLVRQKHGSDEALSDYLNLRISLPPKSSVHGQQRDPVQR